MPAGTAFCVKSGRSGEHSSDDSECEKRVPWELSFFICSLQGSEAPDLYRHRGPAGPFRTPVSYGDFPGLSGVPSFRI